MRARIRPQASRRVEARRRRARPWPTSAAAAATVRCTVPAPALGRVDDLQVLDVDLALPERRGELGESARDGRGSRPGGRRRPPGPAAWRRGAGAPPSPRRTSRSTSPAASVICVAQPLEPRHVEIDRAAIASRFESRISLHSAGVRGGEPREVAEPASGQQQDVGLVGLLGRREAHQRRRGDLRQVAHERHQSVVALRRPSGRRAPPSPRTQRLERDPRASGSETDGGRQHPHDAVDDRGRGVVGARCARCRPSGGPGRTRRVVRGAPPSDRPRDHRPSRFRRR